MAKEDFLRTWTVSSIHQVGDVWVGTSVCLIFDDGDDKVLIQYSGYGTGYPSVQPGVYDTGKDAIAADFGSGRKITLTITTEGHLSARVTDNPGAEDVGEWEGEADSGTRVYDSAMKDFFGAWKILPENDASVRQGTLYIYPDEINHGKLSHPEIHSDLGDKVLLHFNGFSPDHRSYQNGHYKSDKGTIVFVYREREVTLFIEEALLRAKGGEVWSATRKER